MALNKEEIKESKAGLAANIIGAIAFLALGICLITLGKEKLVYIVHNHRHLISPLT